MGHPQTAAAAGGRRRPARGAARLRDLGAPRPRRLQRGAGAARPDRGQPRRRSRRAGPPHARLVGRARRAWPPPGHRPLVHRRPQRAGRLPGQHRAVLAPARREAVGRVVPVPDAAGHGDRRGAAGRRAGDRPLGPGDRRLDGRDARAGVGGDASGPHGRAAAARHHGGGQRRADRARLGAAARDPLGPGLARRRLPRRRPGAGPARRAGHRPAARPHHLPQRGGAAGPFRPPPAGRRGPVAVRPLPGGVLPRPPRRQAGAALRRGQLRRPHRGDERPRRRPRPRRDAGGAAAGDGPDAGRRGRLRPALPAGAAGGAGRRDPGRRPAAGDRVAQRPRRLPHRDRAGRRARPLSARPLPPRTRPPRARSAPAPYLLFAVLGRVRARRACGRVGA